MYLEDQTPLDILVISGINNTYQSTNKIMSEIKELNNIVDEHSDFFKPPFPLQLSFSLLNMSHFGPFDPLISLQKETGWSNRENK